MPGIYAFKDSETNKRTFFLMVDPLLLPFSLSPPAQVKNYKPIKTTQGFYVNVGHGFGKTHKQGATQEYKDKFEASRYAQLDIAIAEINQVVVRYIAEESLNLIKYWNSNVDMYFNRSSHGRYYPERITGFRRVKNIPKKATLKYPPHKMSTKTGQLRRALRLESINFMGARLFVYPCYSHGNYSDADYVTFLVMGAPLKVGNHYVPQLNKRVYGGMWGGITAAYWTRWQNAFNKQVVKSQRRLNRRVKLYMDTFMKKRNNQVLFDPQMLTSKPKQREHMMYKKYDENRFNASMKLSDIFDDESEYTKFLTSPIDTTKPSIPLTGPMGSQILGPLDHLTGQNYSDKKSKNKNKRFNR